MTDQTIKGPRGALFLDADTQGRGAPVLFIHSDGGTHAHWDQARKSLKGERPTAAFDRRGHGRSDPPKNGSFALSDAARDIGAVADALGWNRFVLVGHSGGALTAYTYACENPGRIAGLILVDSPPDPAVLPPGMMEKTIAGLKGRDSDRFIETYYRQVAGPDPKIADRVVEDIRATPKATVIGVFEAQMDFKPAPYALWLAAPTLAVIQSQFDVPGAIHRIPPGMETVAVDGVGHWIHLGAPDRFAEILDAFLEDVDDRERRGQPSADPENHAP